MSDERFEQLMNDKLDDLLTPAEEREFAALLAANPAYRREYEQMAATLRFVEDTPPVQLPAGFSAGVLAQIRIPFWLRVKNAVPGWIPQFVLRPAFGLTVVAITILCWNSYTYLFEQMFGVLTWENLYRPFLNSGELKEVAFWLGDTTRSIIHLFETGGIFYELSKKFFSISATLWNSLSYLLPVAAMVLFTWTITLYLFTNSWRLHHEKVYA